jgi:hypothetical protein
VPRRWLVFVHHMPAHPSSGRVKIWRRLQQVGAIALKNAVHVLPDTAQSVEDFEWLRGEVVALGGEASVFSVPSMSEADERYILSESKEKIAMQASEPHPTPTRSRSAPSAVKLDANAYRDRTWVTRPRPGVDRFASAWFIRRFVDRHAAFLFAVTPDRCPDAVPFDMYQAAGFRHEGDLCTFEVLQARFGVRDAAVSRIAEIVHDVDLKEDHYRSPHAATVASLVEGLRASIPGDLELLEQGIVVFEALYQSFRPAGRARGGRGRIC